MEVRLDAYAVAVRDSTNKTGPVITVSAQAWRDFVGALKAGEFDRP